MLAPNWVVIAGDWHGDTGWSLPVIRRACAWLREQGETTPLIIHLGDFGVWGGPGGVTYLNKLNTQLFKESGYLWFLDGNHEHFLKLAKMDANPDEDGLGIARPRILHLPRAHRWNWHGRTWMSLGGAVSVDRDVRTEGVDWFPEETITIPQAAVAMAGGHADVVLTHDLPSGVRLTLPPPPQLWLPYIDKAHDHRRLLQGIFDVVTPSYNMNGHYHMAWSKEAQMPWGIMRSTGLDCNGGEINYLALNTVTMELVRFE